MAARDQERLRLGRQPAPPGRVLMACRIPLGLGTCWGGPTSRFLTRFASRVHGYPKSCGVSIRVPQDLITLPYVNQAGRDRTGLTLMPGNGRY